MNQTSVVREEIMCCSFIMIDFLVGPSVLSIAHA